MPARPIQKAAALVPEQVAVAAHDVRRASLRRGQAGHPGPDADAHAPAHRERSGVRGHGVVRQPHVRRSDGTARPNSQRRRCEGSSVGAVVRPRTQRSTIRASGGLPGPDDRRGDGADDVALEPADALELDRLRPFRVADTDGRLTTVHGQDPERPEIGLLADRHRPDHPGRCAASGTFSLGPVRLAGTWALS